MRGYSQDGTPRLTAVPAARSRAAALKVRFALLLTALLLSSAVGLFAAFAFLSFDPPVVDVDAAKPRGRAMAELAAYAYINGSALPLPVIQGEQLPESSPIEVKGPITWDGFDRQALPSGETVEAHRFLFYRPVAASADQTANQKTAYQLMLLTVLVGTPTVGNPVLAARPHFAPAPWRDNSTLVANYSDAEPVTLPTGAVEQLSSWAGAWAINDAEKLKLLTGDQTAGVRYVGLGGYQFVEMRLIASIRTAADGFLVRARVVLASANESRLEMDMDITVDSASTGLPNVIGWGPAGSGITAPADVRVTVDQ
jgi:hypothetical protein